MKYQSLIKKSKFPEQENQGYAFKATNQAKSITKPLQTDPPLVLSSLSSSQIHGSIPTDANPTANPPREDHICGEAHDKTLHGTDDPPDSQVGTMFQMWIDLMPEPPKLVVNLLIPNEIYRLIRLLSYAYVSSFPSTPISMLERHPNFASSLAQITCMIWNV